MGYIMRDKKFVTPQGVLTSMILGIFGCIVAPAFKSALPAGFPYTAVGIIFALIGFFGVCAATKDKHYSQAEAK
jgi:uncharacterized membrane protein YeaQ/YmgE (transglycosylase-associated protein family)